MFKTIRFSVCVSGAVRAGEWAGEGESLLGAVSSMYQERTERLFKTEMKRGCLRLVGAGP
jgi:hypothetical protein